MVTLRDNSTVATFGMGLRLKTGEELPAKYERVGLNFRGVEGVILPSARLAREEMVRDKLEQLGVQ
jgi:hypothetical protein